MSGKPKRIVRRIAALLAFTFALVTMTPLMADAKEANLGVGLGEQGFVATGQVELSQSGIKEEALNAVRKWRQDALDDTSVKVDGMTMREYIASLGITESEYLNPQWSNYLERVAIQRTFELFISFSHTRPSGDSCFTAGENASDVWHSGEIIAGGGGGIAGAINLWAGEKSDYVNDTGGETGHYTALIMPETTAYGFSYISGGFYGGYAAGEIGTPESDSMDTSPTNLQGIYDISLRLPFEALNDRVALSQESVGVGDKLELQGEFYYLDYYFTLDGTWSSLSPDLVTIEDGVATGKKAGTAAIRLTLEVGEDYAEGDFELLVGLERMYRFYNQWTGEHLYTSDLNECVALVQQGWTAENDEENICAWVAPMESKTPVYRLYNPYVEGGDHHYTTSKNEYDTLKTRGWEQEGIAWYSDDAKGTKLHRLYNPYAVTGTHHYTADENEVKDLKTKGWLYEGIAWYGVA